jgi:hypothetical protein
MLTTRNEEADSAKAEAIKRNRKRPCGMDTLFQRARRH